MSNNIKALLGATLVVGTVFAATIPADAARRHYYRGPSDGYYGYSGGYYGYSGPVYGYGGSNYGRTAGDDNPGWAYVPQGEYTGYPPWARAALAPKN